MGNDGAAARDIQERELEGLIKTGLWFDAAMLAHRLGRPVQAAELFERDRRYGEAADCYLEGGAHERSLEAALKVPRGHGLYHTSLLVAFRAAVALRRGDPRLDEIAQALGTLQLNDTVAIELFARVAKYRAMVADGAPRTDSPTMLQDGPSLFPSARQDDASPRGEEREPFAGPDGILPSARPPRPMLGRIFAGRYRLDRALGDGATATVYAAHDTVLGEDVALKLFNGELGADTTARLRREIQLARKLTHESIVRVFDLVVSDGQLAISMELIDGATVSSLIERGPLPPAKAKDILIQTANALAFAHERDIVHRDVKPENLLVTRGGRLKVSDFGIAKTQKDMVSITKTGTILGTPYYIAPEQIQNFKKVDHRADIYSLGAMAYELFSGRPPFHSDTLLAVLRRHLTETPAPLRSLRPELPEELERLVADMLRKDPSERVQSCEIVARRLQPLQFS